MAYIILGIIALLIIYVISIYNELITFKNRIENAWAQIDTYLQKRFDTIPNLVEIVKGYANHEKEVFENVAKARASLGAAQTVTEKAEASNALSGTLKSLFAVAEAYPELKASENFMQLQVELKGTEDKIAFSRQCYNDTVTRFNTSIELFPKNIIANMLNFTKKDYFEIDDQNARKSVQIKF